MLNNLYIKTERQFLPKYYKILSTIDSCITKDQLLTCRNWINSINISSQLANKYDCRFKQVVAFNIENNIKKKFLEIIDFKISRMETKPKPIGYVNFNN